MDPDRHRGDEKDEKDGKIKTKKTADAVFLIPTTSTGQIITTFL